MADTTQVLGAPPSTAKRRPRRLLEHASRTLTAIVAWILIALIVIALVGVVRSTVEPLIEHRDFMRASLEGLDGIFLVIILLELVHTTLARGAVIQKVREFLVIGVTSAVRAGLEVVAVRGNDPHSVAVNLAINGLGVLSLVVALRLLRGHLPADRAGPPAT